MAMRNARSDSSRKRLATRTLACMAMMAAISVVLARFIIPMPNAFTRFSIEHLPIILSGLLFGPIPGALVGFVADLVGTLFSGYGYNPLFAVPPILIGLCTGLLRFLVIQKESFLRILVSFLPAVILGSILWQSYWLAAIYGSKSFEAFLVSRSIQFAVTSVINAILAFALFKSGIFRSLHFWPPISKQQE
ncbi:MAG: folate family ECF transporter S component [Clostridia bacterium]|nr:folate family ECF transporter S component [Clostridia bacterium]MBQ8971456.1 folate family ECF transporter S component [Clostridia bacterium]